MDPQEELDEISDIFEELSPEEQLWIMTQALASFVSWECAACGSLGVYLETEHNCCVCGCSRLN